jgi:hypothetical protein
MATSRRPESGLGADFEHATHMAIRLFLNRAALVCRTWQHSAAAGANAELFAAREKSGTQGRILSCSIARQHYFDGHDKLQ